MLPFARADARTVLLRACVRFAGLIALFAFVTGLVRRVREGTPLGVALSTALFAFYVVGLTRHEMERRASARASASASGGAR